MRRRSSVETAIAVMLAMAGCAQPPPRPEYSEVVRNLHDAIHRPPASIGPDDPAAAALDPPPAAPDLTGPQPVDTFIRRALTENREVQAAFHDVMAARHRIAQVTALDDPMVQSVIWPIPSHAPQYSLMGYMPYDLMISQQFPWFGTLRLRGQAAAQDVTMAVAKLAAAQLEVVALVKRAYYELYYNQRAEEILVESRKEADGIVDLARVRNQTGGYLQDVLLAEIAVTQLDRELVTVRQGLAEARADLAQQLHVTPEANLSALTELPMDGVPGEVDRLYRLAVASRPELHERLAAIARDERELELARKRYYPNITLGLAYNLMTKQNAQSPTANGADNVGLVVGFNLPVYRKKLAASVCEAQAKTVADARRYDSERDRTYREVKDLLVQAQAQRDILDLLKTGILPRSEQALEASSTGYQGGNIDYVTLNKAFLELLQVQIQIARITAELGKAMASLERAVGTQINEHPPAPPPSPAPAPDADRAPAPPGASTPSPFRPASS